jgi:anionic cell wall polymer biosynthesis LytR-Cps2A-Psr (LCP) family protein
MRTKNLFDPSRLLLILIALLTVGISVFVVLQVRTDRVKDTLDSGKPLAVLITVTDQGQPLFNQVILYNPQTKKTAFIDVPPETGSLISSLSRVDALSALFKPDDMREYLAKVGQLTGLPVPFYVVLTADQFEREVDLLSGIELFVPSPIEEAKTDPMTLIPSGNLVLDGSKARDYLIHQDEGEEMADRSARHQKIVQSLMRRWGENEAFLSHDDVFPQFFAAMKTNLEDVGLKTFLKTASGADWERVVFQRVLGTERVVDKKRLLFPHYNGTLLLETVRQVIESLANKDSDQLVNGTLTVEILNGTVRTGLATRTASLFRNFGYEILSAKNAESTAQAETTIIDRTGNPGQAQKLADLIRCGKIITQADAPAGSAMITIILGKDFDGRYVR